MLQPSVPTENPVTDRLGIVNRNLPQGETTQWDEVSRRVRFRPFRVIETETRLRKVSEKRKRIWNRKELGDAPVAMVQSADFRKPDNSANRFHGSRIGRVFYPMTDEGESDGNRRSTNVACGVGSLR